MTSLPALVALLLTLAVLTMWMAIAPARRVKAVDKRLDQYLDRGDISEASEFDAPFTERALLPIARRILRTVGSWLPQRNLARIEETLVRAGRPGRMTGLAFMGLRALLAGGLVLVGWLITPEGSTFWILLRNTLGCGLAGFLLPTYWLRRKAKSRTTEIQRALPDALDMLTIGVEAGLAFESAMLRVGEQWDNALSHEFQQVVAEMRLGIPRTDALRRMADRTGAPDLVTFVAVLIQSSQLGVSIAQVLHAQAAQMRVKRRQNAEEQSKQASVKIVIIIALFILPSLFIVVLGPAIPRILESLGAIGG